MRKHQPGKDLHPDVPIIPETTESTTTQIRSYELLTPLFGGSPNPNVSDPISVIRATEIRGQLRFWWRACYGGNYVTVKEMKTAEDKLWGKAHKKGEIRQAFHETIQLCITDPACISIPAFRYEWDIKKSKWKEISNAIPEYAAFPLQAEGQNTDPKQKPISRFIFTNVTFKLAIQFPTSEQGEIEGALWAWATFGGIGGRTRRGFGALRQSDQSTPNHSPQDPKHVTEWIQTRCRDFNVSQKAAPGNTPCLAQIVDATTKEYTLQLNNKPILGVIPGKDAKEVWVNLIDKLRKFRQIQKNSPWPETKVIKELIGKGLETMPEQTKLIESFPKAALGLPINFHHAKTNEKLTLQGPDEGRERFASPLILRPLYCLNKQYVGIALVLTNRALPAQHPILLGRGLDKKGKIGCVSTDVASEDQELMQHLGDEKDVVLAFMKKNFRS